MPVMTEEQLRKRDMNRDIGKELLQAVREMKAGKAARVHYVDAEGTVTLSGPGKSRVSILIDNTTLERLIAECKKTRKGHQTLINDALAQHVFGQRGPLTAVEVRKIFREELARSTKGQAGKRRERPKKTRVRAK